VLSTRRDKDAVTLEVADTGIGISPEELPHVLSASIKLTKLVPRVAVDWDWRLPSIPFRPTGGKSGRKAPKGKAQALVLASPLKPPPV